MFKKAGNTYWNNSHKIRKNNEGENPSYGKMYIV